ncbi:MAG: peroxidase [Deltaproteobacteria bacterium]|nr:peroxidase [Deltaproteobacteria bacterium]MCZ6621547.1 peroxidase [Deltaproteobacteria bacterium]
MEGIKEDYKRLEITPAELAMLDYAVKLTVTPSSIGQEDMEELRRHGFDDRDILDIIYVICLYNFNDRLADATGITGQDFAT